MTQAAPFDTTLLVVVLGGLGLLCLIAFLAFTFLASRRKFRQDLRELILVLEDLRSGRLRRRAEVEPRSPVAPVADAVNRLSQDLSARWVEAGASSQKLRAFLDAAREYALVVADGDWDIRSFDGGATAMFGWEEEDVLGRPASLLFDGESWKDLLPKLARRSLRDRGVDDRCRLVTRDAKRFEGRVAVRMLRGDRGSERHGYLLAVRDVSDEARLEGELRESETRYRSLVEGLAEGVLIVQDGAVVYANPALAALCGAEVPAMLGRPFRQWVATRDVLVVEEMLERLAGEAGGTQELRLTLLGSDGERRADVRLRASAVRHQDRPAVLASVLDETADRRVEGELRSNEARLDAVLEATSDGILVFTGEGEAARVAMTNRAFLDMLGLDQREVLGAAEDALLRKMRKRGGDLEQVAAFLARSPSGTRREAVTLEGPKPRVLELRVAPLAGRDGEPMGRIVACRDLTDRKAFEERIEANAEQLRRSKEALEASHRDVARVNADLERRTAELADVNRELRKLSEMKTNLLASVSHELQTPLVSIRGYTEMILKGRLGAVTDEQRRGLELSLRNIDRLVKMIEELSTVARMDREGKQLHISSFPLREVVDECLDLLRARIAERRITVSVDFDADDLRVEADRDGVQQVFLNLLSNAVKYNREGGGIEISARKQDAGHVAVEVRDTGEGIPKEDLERIFDRYYRSGEAEGGRPEGSGIGLALVRSILRQHGCTIRAESELGRGSVFCFTLPPAGSDGGSPGGDPGREHAGDPSNPGRSPERAPVTERGSSESRPRRAIPRFRVIRRSEDE